MTQEQTNRRLISSGSPYEALVGYSRAVVQGDWCFVAGTTGGHPVTKDLPDCVIEQTKNAFEKIVSALDEAGFSLSDVVRATYYITDISYHDEIMPVLRSHFGTIRPAATCVVVASLIDAAMKVEVEVTALRGS
jgi:enamine deaminase RidA (YjgF/YER057c/UK114 family)